MATEFFKVNGVRVANIKNNSGIVLFGIGVRAGSNYETPEVAGISHFAEHLFFKGTDKRSWKQINEEFAKLGVNNNAYTSNNEVFYHTTCPKENVEPVIELMMDMFFNSTIPEEEVEKERGVVIEERKTYQDDPKSSFSSKVYETFFTWNIGHNTIGTFETINGFSRDKVISFLDEKVNPNNFVFVCSGNIDSKDLKEYISKNIPKDSDFYKGNSINEVGDGYWGDIVDGSDVKFIIERKNITQANVSMLTRGLSVDDASYHDSVVLYKALGGGMYSKLASRIREELGLCYGVGMYNWALAYPDRTLSDLWGYTSPENVDLFVEESEKIIRDVVKNGIDQDLFECAKTDCLASILRGTETSAGKAKCLIKKCVYGETASVEDVISKVRNVKLETCNQLAGKLLDVPFNWAIMIPPVDE